MDGPGRLGSRGRREFCSTNGADSIRTRVGLRPLRPTRWNFCRSTISANIERIGIARCYLPRHGPGPLPTETNALCAVVFDHNRKNEWQGPVRYGWPDMVLMRYALDSVKGLDTIALTHLYVVAHAGLEGVRGLQVATAPA